MKKRVMVKLILAILGIAIFALFLFMFKRQGSPDILSQLQSEYGNVEIADATFQGYNSQKATVRAGNKTILLQVVRKINKSSRADVITRLENKITEIGKEREYFDPYKGELVKYSVPNEFQPSKEEISVRGVNVSYYVVYANEIFSYFVFSQEQAKFKGVVSVFSCKDNVYKLDLFSETASFDKGALVRELEKLYCS